MKAGGPKAAPFLFPLMSDRSTTQPPADESPILSPAIEAAWQVLAAEASRTRSAESMAQIRRAFEFTCHAHEGQTRKSGEPYVLHPVAVAHILAQQQMDTVCIETALLHDTIEDTGVTREKIEELFGKDVALCVDGVTKLGKLPKYSREQRQAESVRKMFLAMVSDLRVILVKLADRLHNMRTLESLSREQQIRIAQETLDLYAPVAHRLGMGKVRVELEDLAFRWLEPEEYREVVGQIDSVRKASEEYLAEIRTKIARKLVEEQIPSRVEARLKRPYSVWVKLKRQRIGIDQVYDLLALRIVTDTLKNCYGALGIIHNEWPPIPGRVKDFIAMPRPNMYQSLHTSVMGSGGQMFEVQIRTEDMHRTAEEGIAAHWKYKERRGHNIESDERIKWVRQLVQWQGEMRDSDEFRETLRLDLYAEEVYVFTPKGKVVVLPRGSTPIDFAYAIHSDIGDACAGAMVNNRMAPLRYELQNGDVVEVQTQANHKPSRDWLTFARTSKARNKIRQYISQTERESAVDIGLKMLEKEARRLRLSLKNVSEETMQDALTHHGLAKVEDAWAAIGYGKLTPRPFLQRLFPEQVGPEADEPAAESTADAGSEAHTSKDLVLRVRGLNDVLIHRANCCNPIRGEAIVGYVSRGKGVAVHARSCTNVKNLLYEADRRIDVEWATEGAPNFTVRVIIYTEDRPGMLAQFTACISAEHADIRTLEASGDPDRADAAIVSVSVQIRDKKQLEKLISALRRIPGVRDVERKE
jgi:GTP diphosphokinase / guanosine-3',5'-bis(diphosphate) 3'-diphosphatase